MPTPKKKTPATTEPATSNEASNAQEGQLLNDLDAADQMAGAQLAIREEYGNALPYDRSRIIAETRFFMAQSAEAMLEAGKRLVLLKEHEAHGDFTDIVENSLGMDSRVARRMMQAAVKFLAPQRQGLADLGKAKLYELMVYEDEDLDALAEGGTLAGKTFDEIDRMSTRELKAALRKEKQGRQQDSETTDKLLSAKDQKLNALDKQLTEAQRSGPRVMPWKEEVAAINAEAANYCLAATECVAKLAEIHGALPELELADPAAPSDTPTHAIVLGLHDGLARLASQIGAIQNALYLEFQHVIEAPRFDLAIPE